MSEAPKTIPVFLGASTELELDQIAIADFIAELNKLTVDRGAYFKLVRWQWDGRNDPLRDYDHDLRESELALFLYFTTVDAAMEERFDAALDAFRRAGKPKIVTWFKQVSDDAQASAELDAFKIRLDAQLHHFYNTYSELDSVKLGVLLQLARDAARTGEAGDMVSVADDALCLWGEPVIDLAHVPAYRGWRTIRDARERLDSTDERYLELKTRYLEDPESDEIAPEFLPLASERTRLRGEIARCQKQFLDFMSAMASDVADRAHELTPRQRTAYRLVEQGDFDAAIAVLDEREIAADRAEFERDLELVREAARAQERETLARLAGTVREQLQLDKLLRSQIASPELLERRSSLLHDAAACERRHGLGVEARRVLAVFLVRQRIYDEAAACAREILDVLSSTQGDSGMTDERRMSLRFDMLNIIEAAQSAHGDDEKAVDTLRQMIDVIDQGDLSDARTRLRAARAQGNLASTLTTLRRSDEAREAYRRALELASPLVSMEGYEADAQSYLAGFCKSQSRNYQQMGRIDEARAAAKEAIDHARSALELDKDSEDLADGLAAALAQSADLRGDSERDERLRELDEAISIYRDISSRNPGVWSHYLAILLAERGDALCSMGRTEEALESLREGAEAMRVFGRANEDPACSYLDYPLRRLRRILHATGDGEGELACTSELIDIMLGYYERNPTPDTAARAAYALNERARLCARAGDEPGRLQAIDDALRSAELLGRAAHDDPGQYGEKLDFALGDVAAISGSVPVADAALHARLVNGLRTAVRRGRASARPLLFARLGDAAHAALDSDPLGAAILFNEALDVLDKLIEEHPEIDAEAALRELEAGSSRAFRASIEAIAAADDVPSGLKDALRSLASALEAQDEAGVAKAARDLREEVEHLADEGGDRDGELLDALAALDELVGAGDGTPGPNGADGQDRGGKHEGWSVVD